MSELDMELRSVQSGALFVFFYSSTTVGLKGAMFLSFILVTHKNLHFSC